MLLTAQYYDHPDGKDAFGKVVATNRYAILGGLAYSTMEILCVSKPQGYQQTLARYMYFTGPLIGMATAFTMVTFTATNLRGKDDKLNYVLGGMAAGAVAGAWKRSVPFGCVTGLGLVVCGILKKASVQDGWNFFPEKINRRYDTLIYGRKDYTLMEERPKNWTTGKN